MDEKQIGTVDHFFGNISVSMIKLTDALKVGDKIRIKGSTSDFVQDISSMQIDRVPAQEGRRRKLRQADEGTAAQRHLPRHGHARSTHDRRDHPVRRRAENRER